MYYILQKRWWERRLTYDMNTWLLSIFTQTYEKKFLHWYRRTFSVSEIEQNVALQLCFGALLLVFLFVFSQWINAQALTIEAVTTGTHVCKPYFQDCGALYFLEALPQGYSQNIFYLFLFVLIGGAVLAAAKKEWIIAHMSMTLIWIWTFLVVYVLTDQLGGNYDYYLVWLTFVLLFLPHKLFFIKATLAIFYFAAATIKYDEGWILGTYFTAMQTGLPIFPDTFTPFITLAVVTMQTVGVWLLFSGHRLTQRLALLYFALFHFYSLILVGYRYPLTVLPILVIVFGLYYVRQPLPPLKSGWPGFVLLGVILALQVSPYLIAGDHKYTMEGNKYGLYMFEANHQCRSVVALVATDGTTNESTYDSASARNRCDPYAVWFRLQQLCTAGGEALARITWQMDHSINGGPFYRIVDTTNACDLEYKPFTHNQWIKDPELGAPIVGYPYQNYYR